MFEPKPKGYTIIELMIVLAVASVIMATVFWAIPQLQRNSRDQARKDIAGRLRGEIETYGANHEGQYPFNVSLAPGSACPVASSPGTGDWADFYISNINDKLNIKDPKTGQLAISCTPQGTYSTSEGYVLDWDGTTTLPSSTPVGAVDIIASSQCNGQDVTTTSAANAFSVLIGLENGQRFCTDNR